MFHSLIPLAPHQQNNDEKQTNNSWLYRSFSRNIHVYTTNTLKPIIKPSPPPPQKKTKKKQKKTKTK